MPGESPPLNTSQIGSYSGVTERLPSRHSNCQTSPVAREAAGPHYRRRFRRWTAATFDTD